MVLQTSLGLVALGIEDSAGGQRAETFHTEPELACNSALESSLPINISLRVRQKLQRDVKPLQTKADKFLLNVYLMLYDFCLGSDFLDQMFPRPVRSCGFRDIS